MLSLALITQAMGTKWAVGPNGKWGPAPAVAAVPLITITPAAPAKPSKNRRGSNAGWLASVPELAIAPVDASPRSSIASLAPSGQDSPVFTPPPLQSTHYWNIPTEYRPLQDKYRICLEDPADPSSEPRVLGSGQYGAVYLGVRIEDEQEVAVKVIERPTERSELKKIDREIAALERMGYPGHSNVLKIHEAIHNGKYTMLVTELCDGPELAKYVRTQNQLLMGFHGDCIKRFRERDAKRLMLQLADAMEYMQRHGVAHRDIKMENIIVVSGEGGSMAPGDVNLKLIDVGLCDFMKRGEQFTEFCGTPDYCAPQLLRGSYDDRVDIWASGVMLHEMLTGCTPFLGFYDDCDNNEIFANIIGNNRRPFNAYRMPKLSPEAKELINAMLKPNPNDRPSWVQLAGHSQDGTKPTFAWLRDAVNARDQQDEAQITAATLELEALWAEPMLRDELWLEEVADAYHRTLGQQHQRMCFPARMEPSDADKREAREEIARQIAEEARREAALRVYIHDHIRTLTAAQYKKILEDPSVCFCV